MSGRGGRCQEVTTLTMVDLVGVAELVEAADLVVGVKLVAETLVRRMLPHTNSATSRQTVLHQPLAEAMPELGNATGATKQAIGLLSAHSAASPAAENVGHAHQRSSRGKIKCRYCNNLGHSIDKCRKRASDMALMNLEATRKADAQARLARFADTPFDANVD